MPRTAPTVDGTPNVARLGISLIDVSGDIRSESVEISPTADDADIEALVAAYAARSNAVIYEVRREQVYAGAKSKATALNQPKSASLADGINFLFVGLTRESEDFRLMAPIASQLIDGSDSVEAVNAAAFGALVAAVLTGTKTLVSAQYTERKEKQNNEKTLF